MRRLRWALAVLSLVGLPGADPTPARAGNVLDDAAIAAFEADLDAWDLDNARDVLTTVRDRGARELRAAILAFYEAKYELVETTLASLLASGTLDEREVPRAERFLALARGARSSLADPIVVHSDNGRFEAVFADAKDQLLAPYLFDAMELAYRDLGADLGVRPQGPIRFEFLDAPSKLAQITPLSLDNIYTTGTVGVTKYQRIMMVTPRVMLYGYAWIDTAVHEYVHYLVTLRTRNRAPVWLQEGLAKLFETRWRAAVPQPLDPPRAALLHRALVNDDLVTLDEMQPSIAMLPSQERATLAYVEVETMLGMLLEERGEVGLTTLIDRVTDGERAEDALGVAWGTDFDDFYQRWKERMTRATADSEGGDVETLRFSEDGDDGVDPSLLGDVFSHLGGGKARQHARLGVLLTLRDHKAAAAEQYEKARQASAKAARDPKLARRLGELWLELGQAHRAAPLLDVAAKHDPRNANLAEAQARAALMTGQEDAARDPADRAVQKNPFIPMLHCDLAVLATDETRRQSELAHCPLRGQLPAWMSGDPVDLRRDPAAPRR
ncbi:MAG: hypothetical protein B7733_26515 [Myxococcales bacterium FL481]|nr:MAG: hypothetical protein B7733_26515 [Myxococcales bacterium FL481]